VTRLNGWVTPPARVFTYFSGSHARLRATMPTPLYVSTVLCNPFHIITALLLLSSRAFPFCSLDVVVSLLIIV